MVTISTHCICTYVHSVMLSIQDSVTFFFFSTQQVLLASRQFLLDVYQDFAVVWPALLM